MEISTILLTWRFLYNSIISNWNSYYRLESYKTLVDCEFQIEIQFNKYRVECPVDETLRIYLSKLKGKLDAVIEKDKDNEVVLYA